MFASQVAKRADADFITVVGRPHDYARNSAIRVFLDRPSYSHLLFIDSDVEPPLDVLDRLLALDSPIASGCYPVVLNGLQWALALENGGHYRLLDQLPSSNIPFFVDAAGAGCLLIRRDVFDLVSWPWFKWVESADGSQAGEDIYFFRKANAAGLRLAVDPTVLCKHFKTINLLDLMRKDASCS
jgi:hypothetical protein